MDKQRPRAYLGYSMNQSTEVLTEADFYRLLFIFKSTICYFAGQAAAVYILYLNYVPFYIMNSDKNLEKPLYESCCVIL